MPTDPFLEEVARSCRRLLSFPASVLVAVSGGADSTALFHALIRLRGEAGIARVGVAHVNHGLRGAESDGDEAFVRTIALAAGVPCHVARLSGAALHDRGIEAWARQERYRFFAEIRLREDYGAIATAHTANDQAETLIMRLWRGAGIRGLAGIREVRADNVVRPLLGVTRARIGAWLAAQRLPFRHDSSNDDLRFRRNWIRRHLLPRLENRAPNIVEMLASCAADCAAIGSRMEILANDWIVANVKLEEPDRIAVRKNGLGDGPVAAFAIVGLLAQRGCHASRAQIAGILSCARRNDGVFLLPGGWRCEAQSAIALLRRGESALPAETFCVELAIPGVTPLPQGRGSISAVVVDPVPETQCFDPANVAVLLDADAMGEGLCYRSVGPDELFHPLGSPKPQLLRAFLKKHKISRCERIKIGVVSLLSGPIVWIPGLQISHDYRCTSATRRGLRLRIQRLEKPMGRCHI